MSVIRWILGFGGSRPPFATRARAGARAGSRPRAWPRRARPRPPDRRRRRRPRRAATRRDRHRCRAAPARIAARSIASWKRSGSCRLAAAPPGLDDHLGGDVAPGDDDQLGHGRISRRCCRKSARLAVAGRPVLVGEAEAQRRRLRLLLAAPDRRSGRDRPASCSCRSRAAAARDGGRGRAPRSPGARNAGPGSRSGRSRPGSASACGEKRSSAAIEGIAVRARNALDAFLGQHPVELAAGAAVAVEHQDALVARGRACGSWRAPPPGCAAAGCAACAGRQVSSMWLQPFSPISASTSRASAPQAIRSVRGGVVGAIARTSARGKRPQAQAATGAGGRLWRRATKALAVSTATAASRQ